MISFDKQSGFFHLQTPNTSYVMRLYGPTVLEHIYWGDRLDSLSGISGSQVYGLGYVVSDWEYDDPAYPQFFSTNCYPQEYSFFGSCDLRKPAFHAQYADGSRITKMRYVSHRIYAGKPKLNGLPATYVEQQEEADTLELRFQDELTGLELTYRYCVYNHHDAICRNVEVQNRGKEPVDLKSVLSFSIDFERTDFDFINLSGLWARERHIERRALQSGTTKVESRKGTSSHYHSPFFALADSCATETQGDVYGFSLVYSGNFEAGVEVDPVGQTRAFMGINSFDFGWRLEPGEAFAAPEAVMVYSAKGLGEMSRTYHRLYRTRLARGVWRDKERPILINNWEGTYFDFDEEKIVQIAKRAQNAGVELMVLDDGWFGKRNDSTSSLGDWYANPQKLPNGIPGLAKRIRDLGMLFGLWFEPEMISRDSELYRAHPQWCLQVKNRISSEGRFQLVLDLSREDVQEYIISVMSEHLTQAPISYIKWDMNRYLSCVGSLELPAHRQAETYHRYVLGLYRVQEALVTRFPDVLFEGCSGGGGRFDAGQMYYFPQYWTSDTTDALERLYIQHGTSLVMPSAFMGAHISAVPNHQVNRSTSLKTRGYVAMNGQFGYELDVTAMSGQELEEMANQIREYKQIREVVHQGNMYRLASPFDGNHVGWMYVDQNQTKAVLFWFTIQNWPNKVPVRVQLAGLNPQKMYRLQSTGEVFSGAVLMQYGIHTRQNTDADSDLFVFEEV